jgi:hypothetical protein
MMEQSQKKCPFCGESIRAEAIKCRFCGEFFETPSGEKVPQAEGTHQIPLGYAQRTDTEVFFGGPISRITLVGPTITALFLIALSVLFYVVGGPRLGGARLGNAPLLISILIIITAILYLLFKWFTWKNTVYHVTNDRIEFENGIFSKAVQNLDMRRITVWTSIKISFKECWVWDVCILRHPTRTYLSLTSDLSSTQGIFTINSRKLSLMQTAGGVSFT